MKKKLDDLLAKYGPIALVLYLVLWLGTWAGFIVAIKLGFQPDSAAGGAGVVGTAYIATQLTKPLRIGATLALTPGVAAVWNRLRRKPAVAAPEEKPPQAP